MRIGFLGAGKVGFTLGKYFATHGKEVTGYYSRNTSSASEAAEFTGTSVFETIEELVGSNDVIFLTVPDGSITSVYEQVIQYPVEGKLICHCSGALASKDAFPGIKDHGAFGYSVHPLFAVSDKYRAYEELADVFFAVEGDDEHMSDIEGMMRDLWLRYQRIDSSSKTGYHCAAAMVSNLMVGLIAQGVDILKGCGFTEEDAISAIGPLVRGNVQHILEDGLAPSLTGPLERGDIGTLKKHLGVLEGDKDKYDLYRILSKSILPVAENKHPDRDYSEIEELLESEK